MERMKNSDKWKLNHPGLLTDCSVRDGITKFEP